MYDCLIVSFQFNFSLLFKSFVHFFTALAIVNFCYREAMKEPRIYILSQRIIRSAAGSAFFQ